MWVCLLTREVEQLAEPPRKNLYMSKKTEKKEKNKNKIKQTKNKDNIAQSQVQDV